MERKDDDEGASNEGWRVTMTTEKQAGEQRVLVVDAEPAIRDLLALALPRHGLEVVVAANTAEAVEALAHEADGFSVALLSVRGADGTNTLAALREIDPVLKVVFMTGDMDPNL